MLTTLCPPACINNRRLLFTGLAKESHVITSTTRDVAECTHNLLGPLMWIHTQCISPAKYCGFNSLPLTWCVHRSLHSTGMRWCSVTDSQSLNFQKDHKTDQHAKFFCTARRKTRFIIPAHL
eukprot:Blabericola_migrator_1__3639@NODE_208_length_11399_cov_361_320155_g179_i0_p4_GENE_NODE_208_length_11399_cov_361_320155_g179_i0NODE_208_length_11399_cov_361_320155_g179_i0_p4_ORF_typecomplete_len122_score4_09fn2/PF00040_19/5_9e03fn2/PF00040_19/0_24_NODE_208_length_11399_cov_361_320155_g179_i0992210287